MDETQRKDHCNNTVSLFIGRRIVTTGVFITPTTTSESRLHCCMHRFRIQNQMLQKMLINCSIISWKCLFIYLIVECGALTNIDMASILASRVIRDSFLISIIEAWSMLLSGCHSLLPYWIITRELWPFSFHIYICLIH